MRKISAILFVFFLTGCCNCMDTLEKVEQNTKKLELASINNRYFYGKWLSYDGGDHQNIYYSLYCYQEEIDGVKVNRYILFQSDPSAERDQVPRIRHAGWYEYNENNGAFIYHFDEEYWVYIYHPGSTIPEIIKEINRPIESHKLREFQQYSEITTVYYHYFVKVYEFPWEENLDEELKVELKLD